MSPFVCWGFKLDFCFVLHYFMIVLVLQSFCGGRESSLLYFRCVLNVMLLLSFFDASSWCHGFAFSMSLSHFFYHTYLPLDIYVLHFHCSYAI